MKCVGCGEQFTVEGIMTTCGECVKSTTCKKVRCPACGEDNPRTPGLVALMKDILK
jgi:predicted amidophosphoribosyltransferase